jgi:phosphoglycolate phosphatase-like HAD superfamily hydrolase
MEGVLFDLGVLYDGTLWQRWLWRQVHRLGHPCEFPAFARTWNVAYQPDVNRGVRPLEDALASFLHARGLSPGAAGELVAASRHERKRIEIQDRPLVGVAATLRRLSGAGLSLAVLADSDSPAAALRQRMMRSGLGACDLAVVSSRDVAAVPPEPAGYAACLELVKKPADAVAYVARDSDRLEGARKLGLGTIAMGGGNGPDGADVHVRRFEDLMSLLGAPAPVRTPWRLSIKKAA